MRTLRILNDTEANHAMNLIVALNCYEPGHPDHSRIVTALEGYGVEIEARPQQVVPDADFEALLDRMGMGGC